MLDNEGATGMKRAEADEFIVVIASAGRRMYIVEWFREALDALRIPGRIITTDASASSAALAAGDLAITMPPYSSTEYEEAMVELVREYNPRILVSLNDYEIEKLAGGLGARLASLGVVIPGVPADLTTTVTDKFACASFFAERGIPVPETKVGSDLLDGGLLATDSQEFVVKHRWGSGSSGLRIARRENLESAIEQSMVDAPTRESVAPEDAVVVQPKVVGTEYGLDVVGSMKRGNGLAGVLARRKLRMRAGETDQAITVDPAPFLTVGEQLYDALRPVGLIDVDLLIDDHGDSWVIDINPRFGGGYPFNHIAGARVPKMYIEESPGVIENGLHLAYTPGVSGGKYEGIRRVGAATPVATDNGGGQ